MITFRLEMPIVIIILARVGFFSLSQKKRMLCVRGICHHYVSLIPMVFISKYTSNMEHKSQNKKHNRKHYKMSHMCPTKKPRVNQGAC